MKKTKVIFQTNNGGFSQIFEQHEPLIAVGNFHMWLSTNGYKFEYCSTYSDMEQLFSIEETNDEIVLTYKGKTYMQWNQKLRLYETITVD